MSRRPYDPFSPQGNWAGPSVEMPPELGPDSEETITPVVDPPHDPPPPDAPALPELTPRPETAPEKPVQATKPKRVRRPRKATKPTLSEALAKLDGNL